MVILAYGEFQTNTYWGGFGETFPLFLRWVIPALVLYLACSFGAEHTRYRGAAIVAFFVVFLIFSPAMGVMGAYGPAHVAAGVGFWAWPVFFLTIIFKVALLWSRDVRKDRDNQRLQLTGDACE